MNAISDDALRYKGVKYTWGGGGPPARGWDCSGFVNWVLGRDLGLAIPKSPSKHGPVVLQYVTWKGASTVKGPPQAGDLCIWPGVLAGGHIGIAISGTQMISALNQQTGTAVTPIHGEGPAGVPVIYRRVGGSVNPATGQTQVGNLTAEGCLTEGAAATAGLVILGGILWKIAPHRRRT